jgi:hypothetical protein
LSHKLEANSSSNHTNEGITKYNARLSGKLKNGSKQNRKKPKDRINRKAVQYKPKSASIESPPSPPIVSTTLIGNVRFACHKSMFKCIECNVAELKEHYKKEYTCHQCYYNTSCSKAFEYHLHGHLAKKRIALWNKIVKSEFEEYRCACGYFISASKSNNYRGDIGNQVAAHLTTCTNKQIKVNLNGNLTNMHF